MMESHLPADVLDLCSDLWHFQSVVKSFSFRQCRPEENRRLRKSSGHSSSTDNQIARGIFRIFDENGDGVVSKQEICRLMEKLKDNGDDDLLDAFHVFDKDRDGFICANELQNVLGSLGYSQEACSLGACSEMIAHVDRNGG
ncbi:hypothetical protein KP509_32G029700 [Ceratopteris richardii]|uniref:EF-hand domain-containing protein n=1 Tax=Ceratopteris richardii TaxID=49495 RepID=A0A8T2QTN3_CERRI|nr:hypothetical protein KP509_32G029700 [Ceratopteris richardii]